MESDSRSRKRLNHKEDIMAKRADITVQHEGSQVLLHLHSANARRWVRQNIGDNALYFGQALAVAPRFVDSVLQGMREDGLNLR